jgi:hypothetical protein
MRGKNVKNDLDILTSKIPHLLISSCISPLSLSLFPLSSYSLEIDFSPESLLLKAFLFLKEKKIFL